MSEEKEISKALQKNQNSWHVKYNNLEEEYKDYKKTKEEELAAVKDELRDVMFYLSAQSKIENSELKEEIVEGAVVVPSQSSTSNSSKSHRRKK